ncbi:hypothetical protein VPH35_062366 [Triticum aestivum]
MGEDTQPSQFQPESPKDFSPTADARNKCPVQSTTAQVTDSERRDDETHLPGLHAPPPPGPSAPRRRLQDPLPLAAAGHRAASVLHCSRQQIEVMALVNKLGNLLKKATSSNPTLYQAIRCMSSSKLFVGGLSFNTDEGSLRDAFSHYGEIIDAKIIVDRDTGRSRGFGFITYAAEEQASSAIMALDGKDLHGRNLRVSAATERTAGFRNGAGYGGGGGGFGGGGYGGGGYGGGGYGSNSGGGGDNFAAGNFGGASGFGGNPAGNHGAPAGSTGGDEFSLGTPGSTFESTKNDDVMDDLFKDDEPDKYASKNV